MNHNQHLQNYKIPLTLEYPMQQKINDCRFQLAQLVKSLKRNYHEVDHRFKL